MLCSFSSHTPSRHESFTAIMPRKPGFSKPKKTCANYSKPKKTYAKMVDEAIKLIGGYKGCSQIALENYILAAYKKMNYKRRFLRRAIKRGKANGTFLVHHNHKNSIKLPPKRKKSYAKMIEEAINSIGGNKGCSKIALENYILAFYKKINYKRHFLESAIKRGKANGTFLVHHKHKNNIKLSPKKQRKSVVSSKKRKRPEDAQVCGSSV